MDVCLNRPFKAVLRICWVNYISDGIEKFPSSTEDPNFKIPTPTRQEMIDWVNTAYQNLSSNPTLIQNSFEVCGITSSDPRNNEFYQRCMEKALDDLEEPEMTNIPLICNFERKIKLIKSEIFLV